MRQAFAKGVTFIPTPQCFGILAGLLIEACLANFNFLICKPQRFLKLEERHALLRPFHSQATAYGYVELEW
jgi:hypothetical protein